MYFQFISNKTTVKIFKTKSQEAKFEHFNTVEDINLIIFSSLSITRKEDSYSSP